MVNTIIEKMKEELPSESMLITIKGFPSVIEAIQKTNLPIFRAALLW